MEAWLYKGELFDDTRICLEAFWGFTYCIVHKPSQKKYLGKKNLWVTVKGRDGKRFVKESGWRGYFGSSKELAKLVRVEGEDKFRRDILRFYTSEVGLRKAEMKLLNKITDFTMYFNQQ